MQGKVTALRMQRNGRRVNVYLDGTYAFALEKILAAGLHIGQEIKRESAESLLRENSVEEGFHKSVRLIARRPRSEEEIRRSLRAAKLDALAAEQVMVRLRERGLLHDGEFARVWVENRQDLRPRSKRALRAELRSKGVERAVAEHATAKLDEPSAARRALQSRAERFAKLDWPDFYKKLMAFLATRGFDYSTSRDAVRAVWNEMRGDASEGIEESEDLL